MPDVEVPVVAETQLPVRRQAELVGHAGQVLPLVLLEVQSSVVQVEAVGVVADLLPRKHEVRCPGRVFHLAGGPADPVGRGQMRVVVDLEHGADPRRLHEDAAGQEQFELADLVEAPVAVALVLVEVEAEFLLAANQVDGQAQAAVQRALAGVDLDVVQAVGLGQGREGEEQAGQRGQQDVDRLFH